MTRRKHKLSPFSSCRRGSHCFEAEGNKIVCQSCGKSAPKPEWWTRPDKILSHLRGPRIGQWVVCSDFKGNPVENWSEWPYFDSEEEFAEY